MNEKRFLEEREILDTVEVQARCFHTHVQHEEDAEGTFGVCEDCGAVLKESVR